MLIADSKSLLTILLVAMGLTIGRAKNSKIKIQVFFVDQGITVPLKGATVQCFDEDLSNKDDVMTKQVKTDKKGIAVLEYKKKKKSTWRHRNRGWDSFPGNSNPDIYCKVTKTPRRGDQQRYLTVSLLEIDIFACIVSNYVFLLSLL